MLEVLGSYFIKQRDLAMDGKVSTNGKWIYLWCDVYLIHNLTIGILVLLHADNRRNKIPLLSFSLSTTLNYT